LIIDTHCHLDNKQYLEDFEEVFERAIEHNVKGFIIPAASLADIKRAKELSEKHREIFFSVGAHPYDIEEFGEATFESINHEKCIAVGECGLDYYRLPEDKEAKEQEKKRQREVFIEHIEIAIKHDKPLIVHIRDASGDSFEILKSYEGKIRGVLHCYNASEVLLGLEGFYYGIGGVLTFKNAKKLIEIFPKIPKDKLLIETDSPYLTPHPHRGKRNEPFYTTFIAQKMAELHGCSVDEISQLTTDNAKRLFKELYQLD